MQFLKDTYALLLSTLSRSDKPLSSLFQIFFLFYVYAVGDVFLL